ncbi:MAG: hypothetical protein IVW55_18115 [Chloroflexi bacterium]|nr:hypothetical protein [Chloroflexota bacterium]
MDSRFIQLGNRIIAVEHIVAIELDRSASFTGTVRGVVVFTVNREEPWTFYHGTPEAEALILWSQAALRTQCLVKPAPLPLPQSTSAE